MLGMYQISGFIQYPARNQVSSWIRYPVPGTKQYPVLSGILYLVESHIRYYLVYYKRFHDKTFSKNGSPTLTLTPTLTLNLISNPNLWP